MLSQIEDAESSESDFIECVCGNAVECEDVIACDGEDCVKADRWFHTACVGLSTEDWQRYKSSSELKWLCRECAKKHLVTSENFTRGLQSVVGSP